MKESLYPSTPTDASFSQFSPGKEFKKEVISVLLAVLLFFVVYLLLVVLAVVVAVAVSYFGVQLIFLQPGTLTLILGIGMIGMGLLVLFFLIKFIFSIKRVDKSAMIEITKNDHPDLFSFLQHLSTETKTKLPKRVFLSPDVNASVLYNSSFFSMFFPVKKNLIIGLGLVNSVNLSEFKTIIAHEYGHFSQESMRLGSYVFNVNKVIYNLLYENTGYAKTLDIWASISGYFALFASITVKVVQGIQWILQKFYVIINKSNLSLSRQMEHHADAVSAFVSGSNHMFSALNRLEIGDTCYNFLLDYYNRKIPENFKPDNIYAHHQEILNHYSAEKSLNQKNGLPLIDSAFFSKSIKRRVVVKDQWASHPTTNERHDYISKLNVQETAPNHEKPWVLFTEAEKIQRKMTDLLFSKIKYNGEVLVLDKETFNERYRSDYQQNTFQKEYRGYYDNRRISILNIEEVLNDNDPKFKSFEELFSENNILLVEEKNSIENDLTILREINSNPKEYKTFDYEGQKCDISAAEKYISLLENELSGINEKIIETDKEIFKYFSFRMGIEPMVELYKEYYSTLNDFELCINYYNELYPHISKVYNSRVKIVEAYGIIDSVLKYEKPIKSMIKDRINELKENQILNEDQTKKLEWYLSQERDYVDNQGYKEGELNVLNESVNIFIAALSEREFQKKRKILQAQLDALSKS